MHWDLRDDYIGRCTIRRRRTGSTRSRERRGVFVDTRIYGRSTVYHHCVIGVLYRYTGRVCNECVCAHVLSIIRGSYCCEESPASRRTAQGRVRIRVVWRARELYLRCHARTRSLCDRELRRERASCFCCSTADRGSGLCILVLQNA